MSKVGKGLITTGVVVSVAALAALAARYAHKIMLEEACEYCRSRNDVDLELEGETAFGRFCDTDPDKECCYRECCEEEDCCEEEFCDQESCGSESGYCLVGEEETEATEEVAQEKPVVSKKKTTPKKAASTAPPLRSEREKKS